MWLEWIIGGLFILIYSYRRYNNPRTNRSSTTFFQFSQYYVLYVATLFGLFFLIGVIMDSSPDVVYNFVFQGRITGDVPEGIKRLKGPIVAALALTTLLPSLPFLSKLDQALLRFFWDRGHIPIYVVKQGRHLFRAAYNIHPGLASEVKRLAEGHAVSTDHIALKMEDTLAYDWTRLCALILQVRDWKEESNARYRRYMAENSEIFDEININFTSITSRYSNLLKKIEHHKSKESLAEYEQDIVDYLRIDTKQLLKTLSEFVARGVFLGEFTEKKRQERFSTLGFDEGSFTSYTLSGEQLFLVIGYIAASFFLLSVLQEVFRNGLNVRCRGVFFLTLIMTANYWTAIVATILPKKNWNYTYNDVTNTRPIPGYVISGILAIIMGLLGMIFIRYSINMISGMSPAENLAKVLTALNWSYPYLFQSLVIGVGLAFVCDNYSKIYGKTPRDLRIKDAIAMALVMVLATGIVYLWLEGKWFFEGTKDPAYRGNINVYMFLIKGGIIGALIGWWVPFFYRANRSKTATQKLNRLIDQNRQDLEREARRLDVGEIENVIVKVAVYVSSSDGTVDRYEKTTLRHAVTKIATIKATGISVDETVSAFHEATTEPHKFTAPDVDQLTDILKPFRGMEFISNLIIRFAFAIAHADGVFQKSEADTISSVIQGLGKKKEDFDLRLGV